MGRESFDQDRAVVGSGQQHEVVAPCLGNLAGDEQRLQPRRTRTAERLEAVAGPSGSAAERLRQTVGVDKIAGLGGSLILLGR